MHISHYVILILKNKLSLILPLSSFMYRITSSCPTLFYYGINRLICLVSYDSNGIFSFLTSIIFDFEDTNSIVTNSLKGLVYGNL